MANTKADPAFLGRTFVHMGILEIVTGLVLATITLLGVLGEEMEAVAIVGGLMVLIGVFFIVLGRKKLSQVEDRRGDLN